MHIQSCAEIFDVSSYLKYRSSGYVPSRYCKKLSLRLFIFPFLSTGEGTDSTGSKYSPSKESIKTLDDDEDSSDDSGLDETFASDASIHQHIRKQQTPMKNGRY